MTDELKPCQLTAAETIHIFENSCLRSEYFTAEAVTAAYVAALAALRAKDTPNPPLTLEELRGMGGEPVYIKLLDVDEGFWALRSEWIDARAPEPIVLFHMRWYAHSDYGNTWLAYRRKPEEETT